MVFLCGTIKIKNSSFLYEVGFEELKIIEKII
jgi:hypothetical protein